jgi:uncharacterized protein (DUF1778 family)
MGTWSLPKTNTEFRKLFEILEQPLAAKDTENKLYSVLGDDDLFDNVAKAIKTDPGADVRSLVLNRIWQIYFTSQAASSIMLEPLDPFVLDQITNPVDADDVFHKVTAIKTAEAAKRKVMWALDAKPEDEGNFNSFRETNGMDFLVEDNNERVFRVEAISEVVNEIDPANLDQYSIERQAKFSF